MDLIRGKLLRLIVVCFVAIITSNGANGQIDSSGKQYVLIGKCIDSLSTSADCGIFAIATVLELEIETYSDSTYTEKCIAVIVPCSEFYGEQFFKKGSRYKIEISTVNTSEFGWIILNKEVLKRYPLAGELWVLNAKAL